MKLRNFAKLTKAAYKSGAILMALVMFVSVFAFALATPQAAIAEEPRPPANPNQPVQGVDWFPITDNTRPGYFPQYRFNPYGPTVTSIGSPSFTGPTLVNRDVGSNMYLAHPSYAEAVARAKEEMALDVPYTAGSIMGAQWEHDKGVILDYLEDGMAALTVQEFLDLPDFWADRSLSHGNLPGFAQSVTSRWDGRLTDACPPIPGTTGGSWESVARRDPSGAIMGLIASSDNNLMLSRGRSVYPAAAAPAGLSFPTATRMIRSTNIGQLMNVSIGGQGGTEVAGTRVNAPSHFRNRVTFGTGANHAGVSADQVKFVSENNLAVMLITLRNSNDTAREFNVTANVGYINSTNAVVDTVNNEVSRTHRPSAAITWYTTFLWGDGFTAGTHADSSVIQKAVTVPANGTYELKIITAVTAEEIPEARRDLNRFKTMTNAEIFAEQLIEYNKYWADELAFVETPNVAVNKAFLYRYWELRWTTMDANVPGHSFQFPTSIENPLNYNNNIVLTQPMHIQDSTYFRTGRLAYGSLATVGNSNMSSAYVDNPGAIDSPAWTAIPGNWNNHYCQYIASAGAQAFRVIGGHEVLAKRLAYDFRADTHGQLHHYGERVGNAAGTARTANYLIGYSSWAMTGNDGDSLSYTWSGSGVANINDRPESAYVLGGARAAADLYALLHTSWGSSDNDITGGMTGATFGNTMVVGRGDRGTNNNTNFAALSAEMRRIENNISRDIMNRLWCDACGTFEMRKRTPITQAARRHNGDFLVRVKENNLLNIYSEYSVPKTSSPEDLAAWFSGAPEYVGQVTMTDANFSHGLRYTMYNDEFGLFPYLTANNNDRKHHRAAGLTHAQNNGSNINMVTLTRGYIAAFKYYDRDQEFVKGDYLRRIFDWHAWSISGNGNLDKLNNNEFWNYGWNTSPAYGSQHHSDLYSPYFAGSANSFYWEQTKLYRQGMFHNRLGNFNWLFYEGMAGLTPRFDEVLEFNPVKNMGYDYFIANNIRYHGQDLTIVWRDPAAAVRGATYDFEGTEARGIPAQFAAAFPPGFSVYLNSERLFTIDRIAWVTYNPNTGVLAFQGGDTANVTFTGGRVAMPTAMDTDLNADPLYATTVENLKKYGVDLTINRASRDLVLFPLGENATVTPSASFTGPQRNTPWTTTGHGGNSGDGPASHEPRATIHGPLKGATANAPFWGNNSSPNPSDWYQLEWSVAQTFNTLKLFFFDDHRDTGFSAPATYTIQWSHNGTNWFDVDLTSVNPPLPRGNFNEAQFEEITVRFLRINVVNRPGHWVAISGVQVFDAEPAQREPNQPPVIDSLVILGQTDDMQISVTANITDDGLPLPYRPVYNWEVVSAPTGVEFTLLGANTPTATIVATLPAGADQNTWSADFRLRLTFWDGDPANFGIDDLFRRTFSATAEATVTVRSDPSLRERIERFERLAIRHIIGVDPVPVLPSRILAYVYKGLDTFVTAEYVDVTWAPLNPADLLAERVGPLRITGTVTSPLPRGANANAVVDIYPIFPNEHPIRGVWEPASITVVAGEAPVLPPRAFVELGDGTFDSSKARILWNQVPDSYWISPGTYSVVLDLAIDCPNITPDGDTTIALTINVLPGHSDFEIVALTNVTLGLHRVGNPLPTLPTTVMAAWRGEAIPPRPVAVTWDILDDTFTAPGTKTIVGRVAETDRTVSLILTVIDEDVITAISPTGAAPGTPFVFSATVLSAPGFVPVYAWSVEPSEGVVMPNAAAVSPTITFPARGQYTLNLVVTDGATNQTYTFSQVISVGAPAPRNVALLANGTSLQSIHQNGGSRNTPIDGTMNGRAAGSLLNTWNRDEARHWFQLTFADPVTIYAANVMWGTDGGGTQPPRSIIDYPWAAGFPTQAGATYNGFRVPVAFPGVPMANGAGSPRPTFPTTGANAWTPLLPLMDAQGNDIPELTNNRNGNNAANNAWNFAQFKTPVTVSFLGMEVNRAGNGIGLNQWQVFALQPVQNVENLNISVPAGSLTAAHFPAVFDTKMEMVDWTTVTFNANGQPLWANISTIELDGQVHLRWTAAAVNAALLRNAGETFTVAGTNPTLGYTLNVNVTLMFTLEALNALIATAEALDKEISDYTDASWAALQTALAAAKAVAASAEPTAEAIDAAGVALAAAMAALEANVYALTIEAGPGGTIALGAAGDFAGGARIQITAAPDYGYRFVRWETTAGEFVDANAAAGTFVMPRGAAAVTAVFERIPLESLMIDALPLVTVARGSVNTFSFIIPEGTLGDRIVWTINNPMFGTLEVDGEDVVVTIGNLPGMLILMATDPDSGLRHAVTLRIV